ncbi:MAG: glycosyltransferase family 4 protein [Bacteroidota bacterium]
MKILYIHQHFCTLAEGGSTRSYYLAKALVDAGMSVDLITRHNQPTYTVKSINGIHVHYLPIYYDNVQGFLGRIFSFLKFILLAYNAARKIPNISICYAVSTPLTTGIIALLLKCFHRIPYYFEVGDLWPLAPVQMGVIRNALLKKMLFALERKIYQQADKMIALSPGIRNGIEQAVAGKKIYLIPNIADCEFFHMEEKKGLLEKKFGVEGNFVITYFGTIGKANHLKYLLDAARACLFSDKVRFLIVGKGAELLLLQQLADAYQLNNLQFLPHADKYALRDILQVTDAVYISFASLPVLETGSPNKFFDALASGKLCIVNFKGWIKELTENEQCGLYIDPSKPDCFYEHIQPFLLNSSLLLTYQKHARKLAEAQFSRTLLTQKFTDLFK